MISAILTKLSSKLGGFNSDSSAFGGMINIFGIGIPTFHFQIVVGIYVVQIVYILTVLASGIENGADKLGTRYELGKNLVKSTLTYCFISGMVMLLFNLFAVNILGRGGFGG